MSLRIVDALNSALHSAMRELPEMVVLGEDILDPYGGAFKVTRGLSDSFPGRVFATPISEAAITGVGTGLALQGFRPVVEIMFGDFVTLIADQLINHASKIRWMYGQPIDLPLVIRTPMGGRRGYGATHSQSLERLFLGVPGLSVVAVSPLGDPHIYDCRDFPWTAVLERDWQLIRKELDMVMTYRDQMPSFQEILKEVGAIQSDHQWKTFFLAGIGMDCAENRRRCPETVRLLEKIPGLTTAFFSILSPGKHIPAHRGAWNGILRLHLGLLVPEPRERVRIRIGNDFYSWREGEVLIFDDTFNHEVWNDTTGYRVVLFVDFARPLHAPFHWLNLRLLHLGTLAPFLREAGEKQKRWQDAFWKKLPGRDAAPK